MSIIVFALARITGNPLDTLLSFEATLEDRERVAAALGLDRPLYTQYFIFVGNVLRGEFGESFKWRLPASELVFGRFPASLALAGLAITIATLVAVPLGVITAVKRDSVLDYGGKALALVGQAAPPFWLGLVLIWVFGVELGVVPHVRAQRMVVIRVAGGVAGPVLGGCADATDSLVDAGRAGQRVRETGPC